MSRPVSALLMAALTCLALAPPSPGPLPAGGEPLIGGIDTTTGNLIGGTEITLSVANVTSAQGTLVTVGDEPATILDVVPGSSLTVLTPGVSEPSGQPVDITVRTADGRAILPDAFTYTPALRLDVVGSAAAGGGLFLEWVTDGLHPEATMTVWVGNPVLPDFAKPLSGYAGLLYEEPDLAFVSTLASDGAFVLHFPALPAWMVGFPLHLQGLASKEGAHKGSFTNRVTFVVP